MTTITHDMPRCRIGVRVGRLLRQRSPFLFMSERNWSGADGNNQVAASCFALLCLKVSQSRTDVKCQVGFAALRQPSLSHHLTAAQNHNPEFFIVYINCAPAMPASPKTKKDRPQPCPSQSHLACVIQRNLLARVERIARSNIELGPAVR